MKLILLGAPGAGKGTQAELLSEHLGIPSISTGNMLRRAMANGTAVGKQVRICMDAGNLVPDELVLRILEERIAEPDCKNGYILDGVPRTLSQGKIMDEMGIKIDHVVSIEIDDAVIEDRMSGRRVCVKCGATYHIVNNPPITDGICDQCGGEVATRKDDVPETVHRRLGIYHETTEVLKDYYQQQGKLSLINGEQPIADVYRDILRAIGETV